MDLDPGQPVFVKEVNGNVWRTATVDQPAAEPNSYWVRFPDNSILRRNRSMIKPRSLPSHFELQAEAQPGNFEGKTNLCSFDSFNQLNGNSMLPVTPMTSVTTPATVDRGSKVSEITNPISSTEAPSLLREKPPHPVFLPHLDIPPDPPKVFLQFITLHPRSDFHGIQWMFCVCRICSENVGLIVSSVLQYRLVKHGTMWKIPHL